MLGIVTRGDGDGPRKVAVATCTLGLVRIEHEMMLVNTGTTLGQAQAFITAIGYAIEDARNICAAVAESQGWEYLMFWDDDVIPHRFGTVETLTETMDQNAEIDILGGVYPARQAVPAPIVTRVRGGPPDWAWESGGISRVYMTGTGLTIYRMASLKRLNPPVVRLAGENGMSGRALKRYFKMGDQTDDYNLAAEAEAAGLSWYVHGGITADQIEPDGRRFRVEDAKQRIEVVSA